MKKLVLLLAVAFSASMFSCGGGQKAMSHQDSIDSGLIVIEEEVVEVVDTTVVDSLAADSAVAADAVVK